MGVSGVHSSNVTVNQYAAIPWRVFEQTQRPDMNQNTVRKEFLRKVSMQTNNLKPRFTTPVQTFSGRKSFSEC